MTKKSSSKWFYSWKDYLSAVGGPYWKNCFIKVCSDILKVCERFFKMLHSKWLDGNSNMVEKGWMCHQRRDAFREFKGIVMKKQQMTKRIKNTYLLYESNFSKVKFIQEKNIKQFPVNTILTLKRKRLSLPVVCWMLQCLSQSSLVSKRFSLPWQPP